MRMCSEAVKFLLHERAPPGRHNSLWEDDTPREILRKKNMLVRHAKAVLLISLFFALRSRSNEFADRTLEYLASVGSIRNPRSALEEKDKTLLLLLRGGRYSSIVSCFLFCKTLQGVKVVGSSAPSAGTDRCCSWGLERSRSQSHQHPLILAFPI